MREKVRTLVDRGARAFVVSLLWSFVNPAHERGSSKSSARSTATTMSASAGDPVERGRSRLGEYGRTNTSILDAYLQRSMQIELSGTWDKCASTVTAGRSS